MKDAKAASDAQSNSQPMQSNLLGKVEQALGSAVGCEGMEDEGKARVQEKKVGLEEGSGTG
jgi:hypothetical protein